MGFDKVAFGYFGALGKWGLLVKSGLGSVCLAKRNINFSSKTFVDFDLLSKLSSHFLLKYLLNIMNMKLTSYSSEQTR